jgi:hypothetical protein
MNDPLHQLFCYTLNHPDPKFIHQHAVDANTLQQANATTKPLAVVFALVGLYLFLKEDFSGKSVQRVHMDLVAFKQQLPKYNLPTAKTEFTVATLLEASSGPERDLAIRNWCEAIWENWSNNELVIKSWLQMHKIIPSGI